MATERRRLVGWKAEDGSNLWISVILARKRASTSEVTEAKSVALWCSLTTSPASYIRTPNRKLGRNDLATLSVGVFDGLVALTLL